MSETAARWPRLQDYQTAIIKAETAGFKDNRLRGGTVERHPAIHTAPWPRHGAFGAVFKVKGKSADYAVKVFYTPQLDRRTRYMLIDAYLRHAQLTSRRLVSFAYDENGIAVNGLNYPTLVMEWADGIALDTYLDQRLNSVNGVDNRRACREWVATLRELQNARIAHGDLQHKNILVQQRGRFRLVDYDGMFVPGMEQLAACETGVSAYQHPNRVSTGGGFFGERMDDFSALVILLTLACVDAELWGAYHKAGRLLISEEDLQEPGGSPLLRRLSGQPGPVGALAGIVAKAAEGTLDEVPSFASVIGKVGTEWLADGRGTPAAPPGQTPAAPIRPSRSGGSVGAAQPVVLVGQDDLTDRQRQVAQLLAAGSSVGSIAAALGIRPATVSGHVAALERKASEQGAGSLQAFVGRYAPQAQRPIASGSESAPSQQPAPREQPAPGEQLTPRQREVLGLLRAGVPSEQIVRRLGVRPATLNRHLASIRGVIGGDELDAVLARARTKQPAKRPAPKTPVKQPTPKPRSSPPVPSRPQPSSPVTPRPATPLPTYRPAASPSQSGAGKAALVIAALVGFLIVILLIATL